MKTVQITLLEEIRRVRHKISAEVGHDSKKLLEYYRMFEAGYADRLVHAEEGVAERARFVKG